METKPIERVTALGRLIEDAVEELQNSSREYPGPSIIWFRAAALLGITDSPTFLEATLLGTRWTCVRTDSDFWFAPCYFADRTDFHKYPCLAGVVIDDGQEGKLVLNPYCPDLNALRGTRFFAKFKEFGAFLDPTAIDNPRQALVLLGDFDRSDPAQVRKALAASYPDSHVTFSDMHSIRGHTIFDAPGHVRTSLLTTE